MSYDIYLVDPVTGSTIEVDNKHYVVGGTYVIGGTRSLHLNVTYNYFPHFLRVFGEKGIRTIYGMTGASSLPILREAAEKLGNDVDDDYWKATEGNAKCAILGLIAFAEMRPDGVWQGD